jgi:hypothetical protein
VVALYNIKILQVGVFYHRKIAKLIFRKRILGKGTSTKTKSKKDNV